MRIAIDTGGTFTDCVYLSGGVPTVLKLLSPSEQDLVELSDRIHASGAESIAISLLFSFANPMNERAVAALLRVADVRAPALPISVSHEILPEFREYERAATVVVNAYLA